MVAAKPAITYTEIASLLSKRGLRISKHGVRSAMIRAGIGKVLSRPKRTILIGHEQEVRDLIAANPQITYAEIASWLTKRGVRTNKAGVRNAMIQAGIVKISQSMSAKKARAATAR